MPSAARSIPDQSAILCETCGYILDGLPDYSNCPECGKPVAESDSLHRALPIWERQDLNLTSAQKFWKTSAEVLLRPTRFYRTLATRPDIDQSWGFARIHLYLCSALLGWAAYLQALIIAGWSNRSWTRFLAEDDDRVDVVKPFFWLIVAAILTFLVLVAIGRLAARLTAWEAGYRGLRLPLSVVNRGLNFHAVHYLPVAVMAALTVTSYTFLVGAQIISELHGPLYLYILCAEVILAAGYLFITYWTGMRNMLYANA